MQLVLSDMRPGEPARNVGSWLHLVASSRRVDAANPLRAHAVATWKATRARSHCPHTRKTGLAVRCSFISPTMIPIKDFAPETPARRSLHEDKDMAIDSKRCGQPTLPFA
jgi:hypothetical protein